MRDKKRIFIVDIHPVIREGLTQMINQEAVLEVCGEAADAENAMQRIDFLKPDLAIVDTWLGGESGIELIGRIKSKHPEIHIIALSMHEEPSYVGGSFQAGARGYVITQNVSETIIAAIHKVIAGSVYLSEKMADEIIEGAYAQSEPIMPGRTAIETLSPRELELFRLIGKGLKTQYIAETLNIGIKTVYAYRDRIKKKLSLEGGHALMNCAIYWEKQSE
jgi:DNA-binding NarL/FixJ family response regulator